MKKTTLNDLTQMPKVLGAGLATYDGFVIESQFMVGYSPEKFGAMAARIMNEIRRALRLQDALAVLYTQKSVMLIRARPDNVAFVVGTKEVNLGLLKIRFESL